MTLIREFRYWSRFSSHRVQVHFLSRGMRLEANTDNKNLSSPRTRVAPEITRFWRPWFVVTSFVYPRFHGVWSLRRWEHWAQLSLCRVFLVVCSVCVCVCVRSSVWCARVMLVICAVSSVVWYRNQTKRSIVSVESNKIGWSFSNLAGTGLIVIVKAVDSGNCSEPAELDLCRVFQRTFQRSFQDTCTTPAMRVWTPLTTSSSPQVMSPRPMTSTRPQSSPTCSSWTRRRSSPTKLLLRTHIERKSITQYEKICLSVCRRRQCPIEQGNLLEIDRCNAVSTKAQKHRLGL